MSYYYIATPYSKFPSGIEEAARVACIETARLMRAGVPCFSPIAHTHPIAMAAGVDPLDHSFWMPVDQPMMDAARGLIMLRMESWERSYGMAIELATFTKANKPVVWMDPGTVPAELQPG